MRVYIGLDVHCNMTTYVAQDEAGKVIGEGAVPTQEEGFRALLEAMGVEPGTAIGLECGTQAKWVSRLLSKLGMKPVVISAAEVRAKARRPKQKSDRRDAFDICDGLRRGIMVRSSMFPTRRSTGCGGFCRGGVISFGT